MHRAWKIPAMSRADFHGLHKEIRIIVHVEWWEAREGRRARRESLKDEREAGEQPAVVWNFYQWYMAESMSGIGTVLGPRRASRATGEFSCANESTKRSSLIILIRYTTLCTNQFCPVILIWQILYYPSCLITFNSYLFLIPYLIKSSLFDWDWEFEI